MEIVEKIHQTFPELDEDRLLSTAMTCTEMVNPLRLEMAFRRKDRAKLKILQSKRKEAEEKIKELGVKALFAVDHYYRHLAIEYRKQSNGESFTVPVNPDEPSIFRVELIRYPFTEDQYMEEDHLECALASAQKVCTESILWTIFLSELNDMEMEVKEDMSVDKKNELVENTPSAKENSEEMKIEKGDETGVSINEPAFPSKFIQIFKEGGIELFAYLQSEYTIDDHSPVAKYSYIYRFLAHQQFITARSQTKYMKFIQDTSGVTMSKIFPGNYKYKDDIYPLLGKLKSDFEKGNKLEINRK